eukprot:gnl/Ergobibamus_cyprinoides/1625.p2 GENE.gnl/Ergobibamus_cyprinoides/1625~~gnl/Ergobibamus_cyprinoides/1625.p2  ORF type:complete len:246 (+),score=49.28 gnl/Ergobibamus_cyprinoides/1625:163-900(+)
MTLSSGERTRSSMPHVSATSSYCSCPASSIASSWAKAANPINWSVEDLRHFAGYLLSDFWNWAFPFHYYFSYTLFCAVLALVTWVFFASATFSEYIGLLATLSEATLAMPQVWKNFRRKSTAGLSLWLLFTWVAGDVTKFCYYQLTHAPWVFSLGASIQICVDCVLVWQLTSPEFSKDAVLVNLQEAVQEKTRAEQRERDRAVNHWKKVAAVTRAAAAIKNTIPTSPASAGSERPDSPSSSDQLV